MSRMRVAIIGAGGIAGAHLRAYAAQSERCEIVGIADVDESAAEARADEFGGRAFSDGAAMIEALRPDAISLCTPPKFRIPFVEAAAKHGIAVLCEKPPARTLAETQAIVDAMRGLLLQFAFCHRFPRALACGARPHSKRQAGRARSNRKSLRLSFCAGGQVLVHRRRCGRRRHLDRHARA